MHYVCIEEDIITGILPYSPNVPSSVEVIEITDEEHANIENDTYTFDIPSRKVVPRSKDYIDEKQAETDKQRNNNTQKLFLEETDWKILRHIRQKALNITTTLTEAEYISLEKQRQIAASKVV